MCAPLTEMAGERGLCGETEVRCTKSDRKEHDRKAWALAQVGFE